MVTLWAFIYSGQLFKKERKERNVWGGILTSITKSTEPNGDIWKAVLSFPTSTHYSGKPASSTLTETGFRFFSLKKNSSMHSKAGASFATWMSIWYALFTSIICCLLRKMFSCFRYSSSVWYDSSSWSRKWCLVAFLTGLTRTRHVARTGAGAKLLPQASQNMCWTGSSTSTHENAYSTRKAKQT